jgi:prophage antirepressor-like protein
MTNHSTAASNVIHFAFGAKSVRIQEIEGAPWFCVTDVCSILGYSNSRDAMSKHCREKGVAKRDTLTSKGKQALTFIDEGNLYRLIIKSRKEEAQRFESWVCDEVLPAIRKTGRYEDQGKMAELMDQLSLSQFNTIKGVIRDKIKAAPAEKRQGLQLVMHNRLHTRFNVPRTELIPASQFEAACNFVAAYALEGEYLPKQEGIQIAGSPRSRYLVSFDHKGDQRVQMIPADACVMTHRELIAAIVTPGELPVSTDEMFEFVVAGMSNLKARSDYQARKVAA